MQTKEVTPHIDETKPYVIRRYSGQLEGQLYVRGLMTLDELRIRTAADFYLIHAVNGDIFAGKTGQEVVEAYLANDKGTKFAEACYRQYFDETRNPPERITLYEGSNSSYFAKA